MVLPQFGQQPKLPKFTPMALPERRRPRRRSAGNRRAMESARIAQAAAGPAMIAGLESRRIAGELEKEPGHIDVEIPNTTEQTKSIWSRQAEKIADVNVFDPGYPVGFHSKIAKALNFPEVRLGDIGTTLTTGILTLALGKEGMAEYERDRAVKTAREG